MVPGVPARDFPGRKQSFSSEEDSSHLSIPDGSDLIDNSFFHEGI